MSDNYTSILAGVLGIAKREFALREQLKATLIKNNTPSRELAGIPRRMQPFMCIKGHRLLQGPNTDFVCRLGVSNPPRHCLPFIFYT